MRYVAASLLSVVSTIAHAADYDVDGICRTLPQAQPLKTLCTEPLLASSRQLERSYWSALGNITTSENYRELRQAREVWQNDIETCVKQPGSTDERRECLARTILRFGGVLESHFGEEDEDTLDTDVLLESAQKHLSALDTILHSELTQCREEAAAKPEIRKRSPKSAARAVSQACYERAYLYTAFSMSVQDESVLYLFKAASQRPESIENAIEQRYGAQSTQSFVLDERASHHAR